MHASVALHVFLPNELLAADLARMGLFARVRAQVPAHGSLGAQDFFAHAARVSFDLGVGAF